MKFKRASPRSRRSKAKLSQSQRVHQRQSHKRHNHRRLDIQEFMSLLVLNHKLQLRRELDNRSQNSILKYRLQLTKSHRRRTTQVLLLLLGLQMINLHKIVGISHGERQQKTARQTLGAPIFSNKMQVVSKIIRAQCQHFHRYNHLFSQRLQYSKLKSRKIV